MLAFYVTIRRLGSRNKKKAMEPMTTSPKRTFIGWTKPILQSAAERLFKEHAHGGVWDLRRWLIVLPSSLAKRRLQELLAVQADEAHVCSIRPKSSRRTVTRTSLRRQVSFCQRYGAGVGMVRSS